MTPSGGSSSSPLTLPLLCVLCVSAVRCVSFSRFAKPNRQFIDADLEGKDCRASKKWNVFAGPLPAPHPGASHPQMIPQRVIHALNHVITIFRRRVRPRSGFRQRPRDRRFFELARHLQSSHSRRAALAQQRTDTDKNPTLIPERSHAAARAAEPNRRHHRHRPHQFPDEGDG